jgi:hypothetical protein
MAHYAEYNSLHAEDMSKNEAVRPMKAGGSSLSSVKSRTHTTPVDQIVAWRNSPQLAEVRSIHARDLPVCSTCRHMVSCNRCPGLAYMEGNMRGPSTADCEKSFQAHRHSFDKYAAQHAQPSGCKPDSDSAVSRLNLKNRLLKPTTWQRARENPCVLLHFSRLQGIREQSPQ